MIKDLKKIISYSKEYGFIFPSSEIYDGLQAVYDYGQNGVELKNNIKNFWWRSFIQGYNNIVGVDAAILMNAKTWKASGHLDGFNDLMVDNKDSKKRYRVDILIEDFAHSLPSENEKAKILSQLSSALQQDNLSALYDILIKNNIICPISKTANWTEVKKFNLMFATSSSATDDNANLYLRPETAQGIFVNFDNVLKTSRQKIPFGIAQIGKAFRQEIVARQFTFRMKEFEQMEMQYFVKPGEHKEAFQFWLNERKNWHKKLGIKTENIKIKKHDQLAHYAEEAMDIEFNFPFGFKEVEGIHSRTDFDLKNHQELSKKKLEYLDSKDNAKYTPYVIETSCGLDRLFLMVICNALSGESVAGREEKRLTLKLPYEIAPVKCAILPLMKKEPLEEKAKNLFEKIKFSFNTTYDDTQSIGKRYARQDAIGTPFCATIDFDSLENNTITVRDRDTMKQETISIENLENYVEAKVDMKNILKK